MVSIVILGVSLLGTKDGVLIEEFGFFHGWTPLTILPVLFSALGGIIVGQVTKVAGGVAKVCCDPL